MSDATNSMEFPKTWGEFADYYGYVDKSKESFIGEIEVIPRFRVEQWLEHIEPVRPLPCVRDEHGEIREQSRKQLFAKVFEELYEFIERVIGIQETAVVLHELNNHEKFLIAAEAADTVTAVTTMLEALGIDAEMRDEAQRRVNEKNRQRGRL